MDYRRRKAFIRHYNEYFEEYFNAPNQFCLYESHDIDFLKDLFFNDQTLLQHDWNRIYTLILKIRIYKNNMIPIQYFKNNRTGYHVKDGFQGMEGELKKKIYQHDQYISLDIVNCGFLLIHEIAKTSEIQLPKINHYIQNREKILKDHEGIPGFGEKYGFMELIYKPSSRRGAQTQFILDLANEIQYVERAFKHPKYRSLNLVDILNIYSTKILFIVAEFLTFNGFIADKCYSLNGDEILFKSLKPFNEDDVKAIEDHIFSKTKFNIKFHQLL